MNILSHLYLAGDDEGLMVGNFIADAVKGKKHEEYSAPIARGIRMHRFIDSYTDRHPAVLTCKTWLYKEHGKCAGIITDLFFDYLLASKWHAADAKGFRKYTHHAYAVLMRHYLHMPEQMRRMLPYMIKGDWLYRYRNTEGIRRSLEGLEKRTSFPWPMATSVDHLLENEKAWHKQYELFFQALKNDLVNGGFPHILSI
ncbi:MAG: DUF479 domain-containing protein [Flavobacteriales bacterium]|nr:DUF479 domain-containing protein [Flavobacteriales bacterium]MCB9447512.1 DUF479 domain-containing protein [Flavobacteriales bacterium]